MSVQRLFTLYSYDREEWWKDRIMEVKDSRIWWPFEIDYLKEYMALEEIHTLTDGILLKENNYARDRTD